jgi:hypothetical protein
LVIVELIRFEAVELVAIHSVEARRAPAPLPTYRTAEQVE